jgi:queuine tRNA-ribosyltransferase
VKAGEALGAMLLTWNNLHYYQDVMRGARAAIRAGSYDDYRAAVKAGWRSPAAE